MAVIDCRDMNTHNNDQDVSEWCGEMEKIPPSVEVKYESDEFGDINEIDIKVEDLSDEECSYQEEEYTVNLRESGYVICYEDNKKQFKCVGCKRLFSYESDIGKHECCVPIRNLKKSFEWQCNFCSVAFATRSVLQRHEKIHVKQKKYAHRLKRSASERNSREHISKHSKVMSYHCSHCPLKFASSRELNNHIRSLPSEKSVSFKCPECAEKFTRNSFLREHLLTHSDVKMFQCGFCDEKFLQGKMLNKHLWETHRSNMYNLQANILKCIVDSPSQFHTDAQN